MGVQVIGEKKRKRAERETGLVIDRLLRISNNSWEARVLHSNGHMHVRIDTRTWKTEVAPFSLMVGCWTTCRDLPIHQRRRLLGPLVRDEFFWGNLNYLREKYAIGFITFDELEEGLDSVLRGGAVNVPRALGTRP